jgi:predicted PurR-regulated permease PerM
MIMTSPRAERVPVRTIATTIAMVLATVVAILFLQKVERILVWLLVSVFLATALWPLVGLVERRTRLPRGAAVSVVFLVVGALLSAVIALLVYPLVTEGSRFADQLPQYVADARNGKGPVGGLVKQLNIDTYVRDHQQELRDQAKGLGANAAHVLTVIASTLAAVVSIVVLTFLLLLEGPKLLDGALGTLSDRRRDRVERVGRDCARAVTGYMAGNLVISFICGLLTYVVLLVTGVPYAGVIAVFVAIADLVPLIGASVGAVIAGAVAFLHSVTAGVVVVVFFVVYQQLENHLLQPVVLSRTVKINPLAVLVSILLGVELAGILGALLAIPVAGIVQVLVRDLYDVRRGGAKPHPTVGEDEQPVRA